MQDLAANGSPLADVMSLRLPLSPLPAFSGAKEPKTL